MTQQLKNTAKGFALALAATTGMAQAGGLDRSGQSIDILFEAGNKVELSYGYVTPSVSGTDPFLTATGSLAPAYSIAGMGVKVQVNEQLSFAVIYDQPFGANVNYPSGFFAGTFADINADALTALVAYSFSDRISVFGGISSQSISGNVMVSFLGPYTLDIQKGSGVGYVAGAAYQIPEIALRVALTYRSAITSTHDILEYGALGNSMDITTPQSVNLEFQTGINPKTLVFGSIRWANWSAISIDPPNYPLTSPLLEYDNDVITYSLGVGRKLTDTLSGAVTVGFERSTGGAPTPLSPTDGSVSLGLGLTYDTGNGKITGGVRKVWLGDSSGANGIFTNNSAIAVGVSYSFDF